MLAIRMQRTGRKGHAMFRVVVQDSRRTPSSGRIVAQIGHYDPHTKTAEVLKDKAAYYLENGAQPSDRVVKLFQDQGIALPDWVIVSGKKSGVIRNQDKLRKNRPVEEAPVAEPAPEAEQAATEEEAPAEQAAETPAA